MELLHCSRRRSDFLFYITGDTISAGQSLANIKSNPRTRPTGEMINQGKHGQHMPDD